MISHLQEAMTECPGGLLLADAVIAERAAGLDGDNVLPPHCTV
jgi:hypothetical protein